MVRLRPLVAADAVAIENWPPYPAEFADIDYALRRNGWLAEFRGRQTWLYAAEQAGELVAFSMLAATAAGEAELRVALRPDQTGQGQGRAIAALTLAAGFGDLGLARIHLIVRKNNRRAIALYRRLGFILRGERWETVNHKPVHFLFMDLCRQDHQAATG